MEKPINCNVDQFLIKISHGYSDVQGVFSWGFILNILGWNTINVHKNDPSN